MKKSLPVLMVLLIMVTGHFPTDNETGLPPGRKEPAVIIQKVKADDADKCSLFIDRNISQCIVLYNVPGVLFLLGPPYFK